MTELIRLLLESRVSNALVVAGIVFLGIAIVGRVGEIEPGRNGRVAGGVVGSVLLIVGLGIHGVAPPVDGDGGALTANPTATPATGPATTSSATPLATATATDTGGSVTYPAGFDESGYTDRERAVDGLRRALAERSFRSTTEVDDAGITEITIEADPETGRVYKVARRNGSVEAEFFFESGSAETRTPGDQPFNGDVTSYDRAIFFDGQFEGIIRATLSDPRIVRDRGRTLIKYDVAGDGTEGTLAVSEDGLFVWYSVRVETDRGPVTIQYRLTDRGETTVERPSWVTDG